MAVLNLGADPGTYQVVISDMLGRTVQSKQSADEQFSINLQGQSAGFYWCRFVLKMENKRCYE